MTEEENILAELAAKCAIPQAKMRIARARRVFVEVSPEQFWDVFRHAYNAMAFKGLTTITGMDQGANLVAMYHLARESGVLLNISVAVPKERPVLQTITSYFPAADCYEREMMDLLGMVVEGLPEGSRYPLPDGWPEGQYPLRKDWNAKMLDGATPSALPGNASFFKSGDEKKSLPNPEPNLEPDKEPEHAG